MLIDSRIPGHFIPSKTPWKNFLKAYMEAFVNVEDAAARAAAVPSPPPPAPQPTEVTKVETPPADA